jgi:putative transposase
MLHADRGSFMMLKPVVFLFVDFGVMKMYSRPYILIDNLYSEAQFKTLKYCSGFLDRFLAIEFARGFCRPFFHWYNHEYWYSGIGLMTPVAVHYGRAASLREERACVLAAAYVVTPERFVCGQPCPPVVPSAAWINLLCTPEAAH